MRARVRAAGRLGLEANGPAWPSGMLLLEGAAGLGSLLSLFNFYNRKSLERRKMKRGLGKEYAHRVNFSGLLKMSLIQVK